jgi:AraC family L-rhamnose operon transcriptional activator RhaR/AraC family L-rhamnose operon regulatory protein RhaS
MDAVQYINENFTKKFTVAQLAKLSRLSERDLYRKFRSLTGVSPLEYKRKKQLELACYLLQSSKLSISEIADRCGFCDSNYLTREFTAAYKLAPGRFRKNHVR